MRTVGHKSYRKRRHDMGMMEWCAEREFEGMGMMGGGMQGMLGGMAMARR